jgi:hypothetical protein
MKAAFLCMALLSLQQGCDSPKQAADCIDQKTKISADLAATETELNMRRSRYEEAKAVFAKNRMVGPALYQQYKADETRIMELMAEQARLKTLLDGMAQK